MDLEWFVIAPVSADLADGMDEELVFIRDHFVVYPQPMLTGFVTPLAIAHYIGGYNADVLFVAGHGTPGGIELSGGTVADEDQICDWQQRLGATLVILSACNGARIGRRIHIRTGAAVLYCQIEVPDLEATLYTARFVAALVAANSYLEAFQRAGDAKGTYVFLDGRDNMTISRVDVSAQLSKLTQDIYRIDAKLDAELKVWDEREKRYARMFEVMEQQLKALQRSNELMEQQIHALRRAADATEQSNRQRAVTLKDMIWVMGIGFSIAAIIIFAIMRLS